MHTKVKLDELLDAYEWVSAGEAAGLDCAAYIDRKTGAIHWTGEGIDDAPPGNLDDESLYLAVPPRSALDLGRSVAIRFVETHLPEALVEVHECFRRRGAYARFKALLAQAGQLEAWHRHEQTAIAEALREWCAEQGLVSY